MIDVWIKLIDKRGLVSPRGKSNDGFRSLVKGHESGTGWTRLSYENTRLSAKSAKIGIVVKNKEFSSSLDLN